MMHQMPQADIYVVLDDGRVLEHSLWGEHSAGQAMVARPLNREDTLQFWKLREAGQSDSCIWQALHPSWPSADASGPVQTQDSVTRTVLPVRLSELSDAELVLVLKICCSGELKGVDDLPRESLLTLAGSLAAGRTWRFHQ
jgi:hypothetical protein